MKKILMVTCLLVWASAAGAQDWVLGLGYSDFTADVSDDSAAITLEYHREPFYTRGRWDVGTAFALAAHASGDVFAGIGLAGLYQLDSGWFLEASVVPGLYIESTLENDLGSAFEIRSLLGVGFTLNSGGRMSLAITHKSNAGTADFNPGVNSAQVRWRREF